MFRNEVGWVDQAKYAAYLASVKPVQVVRETETKLTDYGHMLLLFVIGLIREASHIQEFHLLPTDDPIGRQAWWRVDIWEAYWSGHANGMRVKHDLKQKA
jgi:hypothetical protein